MQDKQLQTTMTNMKTYKSAMPELTLKYKSGEFKKVHIESANDIYAIVKDMYDADTIEYNECAIVIFMNSSNNTVGWTKHSSGGTAGTVIDIKIILTQALLCGASAIIISHNHPSSQLTPSKEDINITNKLKTGCDAICIKLLDHVIVAGDKSGFYSFANEGKLYNN